MRSLALQTSITPIRLSRKKAKYSPRVTRMGSNRARPLRSAASRSRSMSPTLSIASSTPIAHTTILT